MFLRVLLALVVVLAAIGPNLAGAATSLIHEPARFEWQAVTTDADGDPIPADRVAGYRASCTSAAGHADVVLDFPPVAGADIAAGTFGLGQWTCSLAAVDAAPGAPAPLAATASFEVTLEIQLAPLAAPAGYTVTITATPQP